VNGYRERLHTMTAVEEVVNTLTAIRELAEGLFGATHRGWVDEKIRGRLARAEATLAAVRAVLDAEIGWENPALLKHVIQSKLDGKCVACGMPEGTCPECVDW
jgi:hypothetical protein